MAITFIDGVSAGLAGGGATGDINSSGGDCAVGVIGHQTATTPTVTDSKGNTPYVLLLTQANGSGLSISIYYYLNAAVGTGHNFTVTPDTGGLLGASFGVFAGVATSSVEDVENSEGAVFAASTSPGPITPNFDNTLVVAGCALSTDADFASVNGGFTIATQQFTGGSFVTGLVYLIQTTATLADPTLTFTGTATFVAGAIGNFKAAGAPPPGGTPELIVNTSLKSPKRPAPFKLMGDGFRSGPYRGWR